MSLSVCLAVCVCVCVCVSVGEHICRTTRPIFTEFLCMLWPWLGPPLHGGADIMSAHNVRAYVAVCSLATTQ